MVNQAGRKHRHVTDIETPEKDTVRAFFLRQRDEEECRECNLESLAQ